VPSASAAMQMPLEHQRPPTQSPVVVQLVAQAVALAHLSSFGQGVGVAPTQLPMPSQALLVSMSTAQALPQGIVFAG
jgi:hypothetical protein